MKYERNIISAGSSKVVGIPRKIRDKLNLQLKDKVTIYERKGKIIIEKKIQ